MLIKIAKLKETSNNQNLLFLKNFKKETINLKLVLLLNLKFSKEIMNRIK